MIDYKNTAKFFIIANGWACMLLVLYISDNRKYGEGDFLLQIMYGLTSIFTTIVGVMI